MIIRTASTIPAKTAVLSFFTKPHCAGREQIVIKTPFGACSVAEDSSPLFASSYSCDPHGNLIADIFSDRYCVHRIDTDRYRINRNGSCWGEAYNEKSFTMSWAC